MSFQKKEKEQNRVFILPWFFAFFPLQILRLCGINKYKYFMLLWKTWLPHLKFATLIFFFNLAFPIYLFAEWKKG